MGNKSAYAYDLGVGFGLASFWASIEENSLASATLLDARPAAQALVEHYRFLDQTLFSQIYNHDVSHSHLEKIRQDVETNIRDHSIDAANTYHLGLLIALAEGQSTGSWGDSWWFAHDALKQAKTLVSGHLQNVPFDLNQMEQALHLTNSFSRSKEDAHKAILNMRISYREQVLESSIP